MADGATMWDVLDANTNQLWCAAWQATPDPDMYQVYYSSNAVGKGGTNSNHYNIADSDLDDMIMEARTSDDQEYRKQLYKHTDTETSETKTPQETPLAIKPAAFVIAVSAGSGVREKVFAVLAAIVKDGAARLVSARF